MEQNRNIQLCGVLFLMVVGVFGYILTEYEERNTSKNQNLARYEGYIRLDGELSILPVWCSTCALIGTSGHLLKHTFGSEIDGNHSCIFRLGFSPVRGMEHHVGARTTVRVVDSFSFFPFLKRPWKLMSGIFKSETWILFGRRSGDITWFHQPILSSVIKKYDSNFLWMTKGAEGEVYSVLRKQSQNLEMNRKISALWFALKAAKDAGCTSLNVYGITDHQICKRHLNVAVPSLYWENKSQPECRNGMDASFINSKAASFEANIPTMLERRAMVEWTLENIGRINFHAPHWPT